MVSTLGTGGGAQQGNGERQMHTAYPGGKAAVLNRCGRQEPGDIRAGHADACVRWE